MLKLFWGNHNATSSCSRQYMSVIFYHNADQQQKSEETMKEEQVKLGSRRIIQTKILPFKTFYDAENYHQKYLLQRYPNILQDLDVAPGDGLIRSYVAAKLNGYIGGYGTVENFDKEIRDLQLAPSVINFVRSKIPKKNTNCTG